MTDPHLERALLASAGVLLATCQTIIWRYNTDYCLCMQVSLFDVTPSMCIGDLTRILEDFARSK